MVLKYFFPHDEYNSQTLKNSLFKNLDSIIVDETSEENLFYFDIILTSNYTSLNILAKKNPCSLIIFSNDKIYKNLPENVFCIKSNLNLTLQQINNVLNMVNKIKESFFRKTILIIEKEKNVNNISLLTKKLGFKLNIYKNILSDEYNFFKNNNKKSGIIIKEDKIIGFFIKKKTKVYYFESLWHKKSNLSKKLVLELKNGIRRSKYFNKNIKTDSIVEIEIKEKFLGEHIGEGLFILDMNSNITFFNNMFDKMFNDNKINLYGKNINDVIHSNINFDQLKEWQNDSNDPISLEIESKKFPIKKYYSITYSPIKEKNKIINICGIIRDITLQKIMENQIKQSKVISENNNKKLLSVQSAIILGFSKLSEYKDRETGAHLERIQNYVKILAYELYKRSLFIDYDTKENYLSEEYVEELSLSSLLHDIGKVGIPDHILLKPGRLSRDEYNHMQQHTKIGGDTLRFIDDIVGELSFLAIAKEIAYYHHEKWNGMGYPFRLKKENIPLSARIVAICDVYDALTTSRPYKIPYSHEKTCSIIYDLSGIQFDPLIISVFSSVEKEFKNIRKKYSD